MREIKRAKMWRYIKEHGSITTWEGIKCANYTRVSAWIKELINRGVEVRKIPEIGENGEHYTRYYISPDEIQRAEANKWVRY